MTTTVFGTPVTKATPSAAEQDERGHAHVAPESQRPAADLVDPAEAKVGRDHVDCPEDGRDLDSGDRRADRGGCPTLEEV